MTSIQIIFEHSETYNTIVSSDFFSFFFKKMSSLSFWIPECLMKMRGSLVVTVIRTLKLDIQTSS